MTRSLAALGAATFAACASAGPLDLGAYTGGHRYSYNTAYSYGFAFSAADTWRRDPLAHPAGIYPYRPYERPILYRAYPAGPSGPPIAVPGCDGLPTHVYPGAAVTPLPVDPGVVLRPVPVAAAAARIRFTAPAGAEVFVEKERVTGDVFETPPLEGMKVYSVRAKWLRDGKEVEQFRVVGVKAGETARLSFGE